ncbi:MAG: hypothetical protein EZS28_019853 [Streblomastix strix]|uniref:Uncharacterized protein n=1 Tax=Streblomastix strix TaxID=222440 RepID=A0A5J4VQ41_9EUKA|nr:MAG: hypothetical protein EZS28_019853 [Streblomastix strix]
MSVTRITTQSFMDITSGVQQSPKDWGFELNFEMEAQAAQIIAEISTVKVLRKKSIQKQDSMKNLADSNRTATEVNQTTIDPMQKIKCSKDDENAPTIHPIQSPELSKNCQQQEFEESLKRYALYDSKSDEKVSIKVCKLLEGKSTIAQSEIEKSKKYWQLTDVKELAKEQKSSSFQKAVECSTAVQDGLYKSIEHIASGNTGSLFEELLDIFEASAVANGDAQSIREAQLDCIQQRILQEEILLEISKKRFTSIIMYGKRLQKSFALGIEILIWGWANFRRKIYKSVKN